MLLLIFLAIIVPQSLAFFDSECPEVKSIENLNITAYGSGIWYEMARYPNAIELLTNCVSGEFTTKDEELTLTLLNVPFNSLYSVKATGRHANENHNGDLLFNIEFSWPINKLQWPVKVLAIDYDRYGIFYSCVRNGLTGSLDEHVWVLARSNKMDDSVKKDIDNYLKSSEVLDTSKLIWIDHSDLTCKIKNILGSLI